MLFYTALIDKLEKPKTKDSYIKNIIQICHSIYDYYGEEWCMHHTVKHYFDYYNHEILTFKFEWVTNINATKPYVGSYKDSIIWDYTDNKWSIIIDNKYIDECTVQTLEKVYKGIININEKNKFLNNLLKEITNKFHIGDIIYNTDRNKLANYSFDFYKITGDAFIANDFIHIPTTRYTIHTNILIDSKYNRITAEEILLNNSADIHYYDNMHYIPYIEFFDLNSYIEKCIDTSLQEINKDNLLKELKQSLKNAQHELKELKENISKEGLTKIESLEIELNIAKTEEKINSIQEKIELHKQKYNTSRELISKQVKDYFNSLNI